MEPEIFYPKTTNDWRKWLAKNHSKKQSVWLVFHSKSSGRKTLTWSEAVDFALCFGWIDSKRVKIDNEISHQYFSKRKAKSTWSKINKNKVKTLIREGLMEKPGHESIAVAKKNGSWSLLDSVEALRVPPDLDQAFKEHPGSKEYFQALSKSHKKMILHKIVLSRKPETRQKRIDEIARLAGEGKNPGLY